VRADVNLAQAFANMTVAQQRAMLAVRRAAGDSTNARAVLNAHEAVLHGRVFDALAAGVPARLVAEELDVSPSRVYQIRDGVAAYRVTDEVA